jgi:archaeal flagellar protein FlaG
MAEEAISTAILTVATIIAALVLVNAMYPSLYSASGSLLAMNDRTAERIRTDMTVLTEWYPLSHPGDDIRLEAWVKNTGSTTITAKDLGMSDLYLYTGNRTAVRVPGSDWAYELLNGDGDTSWGPTETIHLTVHFDPAGSGSGNWRLRLALPNGIYAEDSFAYAG